MVYCGKPSKACEACRAKRTKVCTTCGSEILGTDPGGQIQCDLSRPMCGQCRRASRRCSYRDAQDLVFRNETEHVVNQAQSSKALSSTSNKRDQGLPADASDKLKINFSEPLGSNALVQDVLPATYCVNSPRSLVFSVEDQASSFFFHHYVTDNSTPPTHYSLFLPTLFNQQLSLNSTPNPLPRVVTAIGLASLSNMQSSSAGMIVTRRKHTGALQALNAALQNPETARADSTLMAVLLLGTFEQITCNAPQALKSWANHVKGATAIAHARGQYQVQTDVGRHIFAHLRTQIVIDCFQRNKAVPSNIIEWADHAARFDCGRGAQRENELFQIIARLCSLRNLIHTSSERAFTDVVVLTLAKGIDTDLADFVNTFPDWLGYTTKACKISDNVLSDYYHVYPNTWVVGAYNLYRSARILTHELILNWLSRNPAYENMNTQRRESEILLARLGADICASVPFILGDVKSEEGTAIPPRAAGGIALVWPLYLAATMDTATESTRVWVITRLDKVGHVMSIQQAVTLARVLKTQENITAWDRFESTRMDEELKDW